MPDNRAPYDRIQLQGEPRSRLLASHPLPSRNPPERTGLRPAPGRSDINRTVSVISRTGCRALGWLDDRWDLSGGWRPAGTGAGTRGLVLADANGEKSLTPGDFRRSDHADPSVPQAPDKLSIHQLIYRSHDFVDQRGRDGRNLLQYWKFRSHYLHSWPKSRPRERAITSAALPSLRKTFPG